MKTKYQQDLVGYDCWGGALYTSIESSTIEGLEEARDARFKRYFKTNYELVTFSNIRKIETEALEGTASFIKLVDTLTNEYITNKEKYDDIG